MIMKLLVQSKIVLKRLKNFFILLNCQFSKDFARRARFLAEDLHFSIHAGAKF